LIFLKMLEEMDAEQAEFGVPPPGGGGRLSPAAAGTNAARVAGRDTRALAAPAKAGTPNGGKRQPIFTKVKIAGDTVDFGKLQWSILTSDPDNARMLETLRTLLPTLALHPALSPAARALFEDSAIVIPDGATLRKAVAALKDVHLLSEDADVKGDLFEILVNDLGSRNAPRSSAPRAISSA